MICLLRLGRAPALLRLVLDRLLSRFLTSWCTVSPRACAAEGEKKKSVSGVVLASFACRGRLLDSWSPGRSVSHP